VDERFTRPNIGLINPPFAQKGEGLHELDFVEALLDVLTPGGTAVVVVPMSCTIEPHPARGRLLEKHTLVAQMSLPNDLFHPVGVITCAMVFRAHQPHAQSPQPTWFGYWKDDGYVKTKDRGRIDLNHRWLDIRKRWLDAYHGRTVQPGFSVTRKVTADDEWCYNSG
jgi:type I restriction-modification system DNA methylase subunit